tara:strand:- start:5850 stop:6347 length:498 start_codon:yes stop_codon:yes gene_type:complete
MTRPLILVSSVLLGIGLVAPTMTIYPKAGEFTWLMELMDPESMDSVTYSIFGIIVELAEMNDWFMVVILSIFSVVFPVGKICVFWNHSFSTQDPKAFSLYNGAKILGKFSMAEVFVLSLFLISMKTLPGGTFVKLEYGCGIYFLSVITSMTTSLLIKRTRKGIVQ